MISEDIDKQLEEISLLVVMLGDNDSQGMDFIADSLEKLKEVAKEQNEYTEMTESLDYIKSIDRSSNGALFIESVNQLIKNAKLLAEGLDNLTFPGISKGDSSSTSWGEDLSAQADHELIVDFIEKHTLLLDDYEAKILEIVASASSIAEEQLAEVQSYLKSYLHNIKGDAGSVGLLGVNKATHQLEDYVLNNNFINITDSLLAYKEWVLEVCSAYSKNQPPSELADGFIKRCLESVVENKAVTNQPEVLVEEVEAPEFKSVEYKISGDLEILSEFIVEAEDHLGNVEELLLQVTGECTMEQIGAIFRAVHSVKGGSAYFSLREITESSHIMESLMDKARDGKIIFNSVLRELVLEYISIQRNLLDETKESLSSNTPLRTSKVVLDFRSKVEDYLASVKLVQELRGDLGANNVVDVKNDNKEPKKSSDAVEEKREVKSAEVTNPTSPAVLNRADEADNSEADRRNNEKVKLKNYVKIETGRLDNLIEYIGEMVISSSMLIKNCRDMLSQEESVISNTHQLERISREIQDIGMSMRLIPIKGLFQKMSRVVWDTAKKLNKDVRFDMEGEDTELDRTVIDKLADPLMHMVRNAVDHGIEDAETRVRDGKPKHGTVKLTAYHSGGSIYIEIRDNGKGLSREKLVNRAIEKGIIASGQNMTDEEAFALIFAPGFSTAEVVTDVSGRGVGMDVVKRNIESMRGRVNIKSTPGEGSVFSIELPLTLAIMEGIEIDIGGSHYIVPSLSVIEFLRTTPDMVMYTLDKGETLKFRGQFLPIYRVGEVYNIKSTHSNLSDGIMLIVDLGGKLFALFVDDVLGKVSAVIKNLGNFYKNIEGVSGCAILANGSIGLILDIGTFVKLAQNSFDNNRSIPSDEPILLVNEVECQE